MEVIILSASVGINIFLFQELIKSQTKIIDEVIASEREKNDFIMMQNKQLKEYVFQNFKLIKKSNEPPDLSDSILLK